ncbi:hypothetical protein SCHPADRAFT_896513 [Schizopora paradoxa]|uniref:Uncharacterized protein n=1 Tax=Schizopora paradoxa TaxID=27342 RepID=A0A0H2R023_9AGAM|nr:hypothetical protein SCHPADRAFT_896513 [Schizopora paradoxa]
MTLSESREMIWTSSHNLWHGCIKKSRILDAKRLHGKDALEGKLRVVGENVRLKGRLNAAHGRSDDGVRFCLSFVKRRSSAHPLIHLQFPPSSNLIAFTWNSGHSQHVKIFAARAGGCMEALGVTAIYGIRETERGWRQVFRHDQEDDSPHRVRSRVLQPAIHPSIHPSSVADDEGRRTSTLSMSSEWSGALYNATWRQRKTLLTSESSSIVRKFSQPIHRYSTHLVESRIAQIEDVLSVQESASSSAVFVDMENF